MNPPFEPTEEQRKQVRTMAGYGIPQTDIAKVLDIDPKTLRLHFRRDLDLGMITANSLVAQTLFKQATKGKSVAAAIYWTKSRMGWREKHEIEIGGPGGGPMTFRWAEAPPTVAFDAKVLGEDDADDEDDA